MRGDDLKEDAMFSYVSPEARVPQDHPLRPLLQLVDRIPVELSLEFDRLYSRVGRPSGNPTVKVEKPAVRAGRQKDPGIDKLAPRDHLADEKRRPE